MNISDVLAKRRTARSFLDDPIPEEDILKMIDLARLSPSAGNMQSLKYAVVNFKEEREAIFPYVKYAGYIPEWNPEFEESPVAFIAVLNDTSIRANNAFTQCDSGISMMAISLVAEEIGYSSCILGAIDREKIAEILGIHSQYEILYLVGLGISKQKNSSFDDSDSVKYVMDQNGNFQVPKRKLEDVIIDRSK